MVRITLTLAEFEEMMQQLLEQKPDLTREAVNELIRQKKEKIGAGYLTDQGALFLIYSDLGIAGSNADEKRTGLKNIYVGGPPVSLEARMMSLSLSKEYQRKDGSGKFHLRTMIIYDSDSTATVKLWDAHAEFAGVEDLQPGDLVRISGANVKSDFNDLPVVHVGSGATIEVSGGESDIPKIESLIKDVSLVSEGKNLVVSGTIDGAFTSVHFTNSRGQPGKGLRFRLKGSDGESRGVIIWSKDESNLPRMIPPNARIKLFGVNTKTSERGMEISGNETTLINLDGTRDLQPVVARIVSILKSDSGERLLLGVDSGRNFLHIVDTRDSTAAFQEGEVIECMPSTAHGNDITLGEDSYVHRVDDPGNIPQRNDLRTKISKISIDGTYCIDAIILKDPDRREIQTKSGGLVNLCDVLVGDDSGEVRVVGWRDQTRLLDQCSMGDIVTITDLTAKAGIDGKNELVLNRFSSITKKS